MSLQLSYESKAVLFADVVEAGRLVEQDESAAVRSWLQLEGLIKSSILPRHGGRYVKGLGDGLMAEFPDARRAAAAALDMHGLDRSSGEALPLRISIEAGDVIVKEGDLYGQDVNVAARLLSLAGPGESVISARVRDQLVEGVDGEIIDLGECYLRHISRPVRAYRLNAPGQGADLAPATPPPDLRPTIAVLPVTALLTPAEHRPLGDILAEELIRRLSRSADFNVISRLSTTALSARGMTTQEIGERLDADYVVSGGFRSDGKRVIAELEMSGCANARVVWTERLDTTVEDLFGDGADLIRGAAEDIFSAILKQELRRARRQPAVTLPGYSLLLGAVTLMHRLSPEEHQQARAMLETLIERGGQQAVAHAWMANWHVLKVIQGWSVNEAEDSYLAEEHSRRALDADPESSQALAIDGFVQTHLARRLDTAEERYRQAVESNPNNSLAWLLKGTLHAFRDEGAEAMHDTQLAMRLSPLDPLRFIYETHAAGACLAAGDFFRARMLAHRSRRANRLHVSTLRVLAAALWGLDRRDEARAVVDELRALDPGLTVSGYLKRSPGADHATGRLVAAALKGAGLPE